MHGGRGIHRDSKQVLSACMFGWFDKIMILSQFV